jgi:hypothetical protein
MGPTGVRERDHCRQQMGDQNEQLFHRLLHYQFATGVQDCQRTGKHVSIAIRVLQDSNKISPTHIVETRMNTGG